MQGENPKRWLAQGGTICHKSSRRPWQPQAGTITADFELKRKKKETPKCNKAFWCVRQHEKKSRRKIYSRESTFNGFWGKLETGATMKVCFFLILFLFRNHFNYKDLLEPKVGREQNKNKVKKKEMLMADNLFKLFPLTVKRKEAFGKSHECKKFPMKFHQNFIFFFLHFIKISLLLSVFLEFEYSFYLSFFLYFPFFFLSG